MKYLTNAILLISLFTFLIACSDDDDDSVTPKNVVQTTIENNMRNGTWIITKFSEDTVDETTNYAGFTFSFEAGGLLRANGITTFEGTWSISDSNSNDDTADDLDFNINFNVTNNLQDLNDDWDILTYSDTKIELEDVSGGDGSVDLLTFEKQ